LGVYLSALLIGWWLQAHQAAPHALPGPRLTAWVYLGILLLPVRLGLGAAGIGWFEDVGWVVDGLALFFLLLFVLGVGRTPAQPVFIALSVALLFGLILEYLSLPRNAAEWLQAERAELPWFGLTELRPLFIDYRFDTPASHARETCCTSSGLSSAWWRNSPTTSKP
jgi:hypothetical protein